MKQKKTHLSNQEKENLAQKENELNELRIKYRNSLRIIVGKMCCLWHLGYKCPDFVEPLLVINDNIDRVAEHYYLLLLRYCNSFIEKLEPGKYNNDSINYLNNLAKLWLGYII